MRAVIIDDEDLAVELIVHFIEKSKCNIAIQETFTNALNALSYLQENNTDLLFIDMQMPKMNGFEIIEQLKNPPLIIMVTAYEDFARRAFDFDFVDYLLKPYTFERFERSLHKAHQFFAYKNNQNFIASSFYIKHEGLQKQISTESVLFFEGLKQYLKIQTTESRYIINERLKHYEKKLEGYGFIRIHKSFLVNGNKIDAILSGKVQVGKYLLPIGRTYKKRAQQFIANK